MTAALERVQLVRIFVRTEADLALALSILISAVARDKGIIYIEPVAVRLVVDRRTVIDHQIAAVAESEVLNTLGAQLIIFAYNKRNVFVSRRLILCG